MPNKVDTRAEEYKSYVPTPEESEARDKVLADFITAKNVIHRGYNQFNGRNLYDTIDDWTKRWNGYIPEDTGDISTSKLFLNFTRNVVINFLSKVAMNPPQVKMTAVNKKTGVADRRFAEMLHDLYRYSADEENEQQKFLQVALEVVVKGTGIVYEGYVRDVQDMYIPDGFDMMTGKGKFKKEKKVIFDNCFQRVVPIEDFYIANPYQPDIQKQPFIIWREVTTFEEAKNDYGHYSNFDYVKAGAYTLTSEPTTFYRNKLYTELNKDQVETLRFYNRRKNKHIVMINGVIIYDGPIPFKDGMYPFAKGIYEPLTNDFFWGNGLPNKIMGEQDLQNTFINMMADKTYGSLLPYGMSSDLDDLIEDNVLEPNKIRKVSDISKWRFDTLPGVSSGEMGMFQLILGLGRDNAGTEGGATAQTSRGGKQNVRQVLLKQQEAMQKMSYSMNFLEDMERDRITLRVNHILQFYTIPKIEKITGKNGKEVEQLLFRDVKLSNVELSDGRKGNKVIKIVGKEYKDENKRSKLADELSVMEEMGEEIGVPTEALAIQADTLYDYNFSVHIVKNSSYQQNQVLDQASRMEYANWRIGLAQVAPVDVAEIIKYVEESYDIDADRFQPKQQQQGEQVLQGQQAQQIQGGAQGMSPAQQMAPSRMPPLSSALNQ